MSRNLSPDDLMHGAMYAMEQAGHLLHDALALYKSGRYASSTALSVFAREEVGRSAILLEIRQNVFASGSVVSAKAVIKACDDHGEKLRRGLGGITFEFGPERSADLKGLFDFPHDPQSQDFKKARAMVDDFVEQKARRDPGVTHQKRMRALYVEPTDTGWNRPCETGKEEASRALQDAANAYGPRHNNLYIVDEALAKALAAWKQCPTLPEPIVPPAPWC
jgi:AbiV family abortive infection protein